MRVARVFPTKTNMSPTDKDAYFGLPELWTPQYDEIHISVAFTWDLIKVEQLMRGWSKHGTVRLGGPAYDDMGGEFAPGWYLKKGVTITSRGCPNRCQFCFVPDREGPIRELQIWTGNIIQDNNLLACSERHTADVFTMLKSQKGIVFAGGLEPSRVSQQIAQRLSQLRIKELWLSYDMPHRSSRAALEYAVENLKPYFKRWKIRCYVLIGYKGDTLEQAEKRLQDAWKIGTLPFAMRFRTSEPKWAGSFIHPDRQWNLLARRWTRPAIIKSRMKNI